MKKVKKVIYIVGMIALVAAMMPAVAQAMTCPYDMCVNETGWWRDGEAFNAVTPSMWTNLGTGAMNNVNDGDTVFVYNGTYQMANGLKFIEPNVTLIGEDADSVTLDGLGNHFIEMGGVNVGDACPGSVLDGFTVVNSGAGVQVHPNSPNCIIRNCVFEGLTVDYAITIEAESITFENNVVSDSTGSGAFLNLPINGSKIINNTFVNNTGCIGIWMPGSSPNGIITRNNFIRNGGGDFGVLFYLYDAGEDNTIYLNNFIDTIGVNVIYGGTPPATIYWNSTDQIEYVCPSDGNTYTNYLGNYWSDYDFTGKDPDGDGIGNAPYDIPGSTDYDYRPLMAGFENYLGEAGEEEEPPAPQPDWHQFQKDEVNSGRTNESAPVNNAAKAWKQFTHTDSWGMSGIDVESIVADGKVFVIDAQAYAWAFDAKSGEEIWNESLSCKGSQFQLATPAYGDGNVFFATNDGHVYALNATTGVMLWNKKIAEIYDQLGTPVTYAAADGKVYAGSIKSENGTNEAGIYYCLNASCGTLVWNRTSTTGKGYYGSGSAVIGDYLVYGDTASVLTSVYRDNGTLADEINITKDVPFNRSDAGRIKSSVAYNNNSVYFTSDGNYAWGIQFNESTGYAWKIGFNKETGKFSTTEDGWSKKMETSTSTPAVYEGKIYVGTGSFSEEGKLYCLNDTNGDEIWDISVNGGVQASPAISTHNGTHIYFTTNCGNGSVYCVDESGNELWQFTNEESGYPGHILQGVAISDGYVYFGNDGGYLYALEAGPPSELQFDTCAPGNPYPSISGIHNGTITPNKDILVNRIYTYPCTGTGGHTEFAMIWNETTGECAVANWNGYRDDYHNIPFNKTVTLEKSVIYNYTIRTGSYPQIYHTDALPTVNGWMNCTEFTDANGKRYNNWIPAIKLFYGE